MFTWIALVSLQVPAALLLALLAGILDFVPVVGFVLSAAPAIILGLTVSPAVAAGVGAFYVVYNMVENYYIQPKVYGRELELSDFAVITAFLIGGTLGGVLGALIALPVAAAYPCDPQEFTRPCFKAVPWWRPPRMGRTVTRHARDSWCPVTGAATLRVIGQTGPSAACGRPRLS